MTVMKKSVYIETSVFSFYWDDRAVSANRKVITRDWWKSERKKHNIDTSQFTIQEAGVTTYPTWKQVLGMAKKIKLLTFTPDIAGIVRVYVENQVMPADDAGDAAHLAMASFHSMDYLLTWNCRHIANANKFEHIRNINRRLGLLTPELVTPEQLFEEDAL